jgi:preprotein translocase subunit SecD
MAKQRYVLGPPRLTSSAIKTVKVERSSGQWGVSYTLTPVGDETFNSLAMRQFHALIAIVANGKVYSIPIIEPASTSFVSFEGNGLIEGNFTKAEANQLASQM